jgi:hypothetical protein
MATRPSGSDRSGGVAVNQYSLGASDTDETECRADWRAGQQAMDAVISLVMMIVSAMITITIMMIKLTIS